MDYAYFIHQLRYFKYICKGAEVIEVTSKETDINVQAAQLISLSFADEQRLVLPGGNPSFIYVGLVSQLPDDPARLPQYRCRPTMTRRQHS